MNFSIMKRIIIDTNFLMVPSKFKVDIFSEFNRLCHFNYELCIFDKSINELENIIEKQSLKEKRFAKFALKLIEVKKLKIIKSEEKEQKDVDLLILNNLNKDTIVATQDMELKREILKKAVPIITLRKKQYLILVN